MSFTETTHTSWFARLKNGLAGLLIGPLLVIGMIWLLSWNEGRSVETYRALVEGAGLVVSVDSAAVDSANEGKLVHITGPVKPIGTPEDSVFGLSAAGAVGMERRVEMYQWAEEQSSETKKTLGGGEETVTTYTYSRKWSDTPIKSSDFRQQDGHQNPDMPVASERFAVDTATVGIFRVDGRSVANLGKESPMRTTAETAAQIGAALGGDRPVTSDATTVFVSENRQQPAIGDLRIRFVRQDLSEASFVGAQQGSALSDYRTRNGHLLFLGAAGARTPDAMFADAQSENTLITWIVRIAGLVGMFVGFAIMMSILGIIADVIPFLGALVSFGTSAIALVLTLILGPIVIAIAWIAYRPVLAIAILVIGAALAAGFVYMRRRKAAATVTATA